MKMKKKSYLRASENRKRRIQDLAEIDDNTELRRIGDALGGTTASGGFLSHVGGIGVAVALLAAVGAVALPGLAVVVALHGPSGSGALAHIAGAADAVDEGHVVPEHAAADAVLELHGLGLAVLVDLEGSVAAGAVLELVGPGRAGGYGGTGVAGAAAAGESLHLYGVRAVVAEAGFSGLNATGHKCGGRAQREGWESEKGEDAGNHFY